MGNVTLWRFNSESSINHHWLTNWKWGPSLAIFGLQIRHMRGVGMKLKEMPKLQKWNISSICPAPLGKLSSWVIARVTGCLARGATYLRLASGTPWVIGQHCPCHDITGTGHEIFYVSKFGSIGPFWQRICGLVAYHPVENRIALCISYCPSIKQLLIWGRPNHQKTLNCEDFLYDTLLRWLFVRVTTFCSQGKKLVRKQNCKALMARYSPCSGGDCSGLQNTIYPQKLALAGQICQRKKMVLCLVKVFCLS